METRFVRIGRNTRNYMNVACHPGAIVKYRLDAMNNEKMQKFGQLSQPFSIEDIGGALDECSDEHCQGVYVRANDEAEWENHMRYSHDDDNPNSRVGKLRSAMSGKVAAHDQAVEAGRDAEETRLALEGEIAESEAELAKISTPKPTKAKVVA